MIEVLRFYFPLFLIKVVIFLLMVDIHLALHKDNQTKAIYIS